MVAPAWALPKGLKLVIGILHKGDVSMDWAMMLSQLQRPGGTAFVSSSHWPWDVGRNRIVENAMRENAEYVLMLDSDVVPPRDAILRLMGHKVPIVQGLYYMRTPPFVPLVMRVDPTTKPGEGVRFAQVASWTPGELVPVDTVATGCLLMHRRVLETFHDQGVPWFEWTGDRRDRLEALFGLKVPDLEALWSATAADGSEFSKVIHDRLGRVLERLRSDANPPATSEDFTFGWHAKKLGFPLYVDTGVVCKHVTQGLLVGEGPSPATFRWPEVP